jgi:predicted lipoprotein with Yx(FWY)xxD motif
MARRSIWQPLCAVAALSLLGACMQPYSGSQANNQPNQSNYPNNQSNNQSNQTNYPTNQQAYASDQPQMTKMHKSPSVFMTTQAGMTVYTFDRDSAGRSNCYGNCANYWPPVQAMNGDRASGEMGIIRRNDGSLQWTRRGQPLYTFAKDRQPGDINGDGFQNIWHVVE